MRLGRLAYIGLHIWVPAEDQGYDVLLFAQRGLDATGLDISPTGAAAARK
jgi:hypothetical protein